MRTRGPDEIKQGLDNQIAALRVSCTAFDEGHRWEAMRIATAVHTLVHDASKHKKSLLTLIGAKAGMQFMASGGTIHPGNVFSEAPLTFSRLSTKDGAMIIPRLDDWPDEEGPRWLSFTRWWDNDPIFSTGLNRNLVSRRNLTFGLRNKDGGSHFDPKIQQGDEEYARMTQGGGWVFVRGKQPGVRVAGEELASMRQVGFEVLGSLKRAGLTT